MSISGAQETKSAILRNTELSPGNTEEVSIDAQEDREIVGFQLVPQPDIDDAANIFLRAYIGTDPVPAAGETTDNRGFFLFTRTVVEDDTTNGVGLAFNGETSEWLGHGSGFEWNEDATLNLFLSNGSNSSNSMSATLVVYYREL